MFVFSFGWFWVFVFFRHFIYLFLNGKIRVAATKAEGVGVIQPEKGRLQGELIVAFQELINRSKNNFLHGQTDRTKENES